MVVVVRVVVVVVSWELWAGPPWLGVGAAPRGTCGMWKNVGDEGFLCWGCLFENWGGMCDGENEIDVWRGW